MNAYEVIKNHLDENGIKQGFVAEKAGMSANLLSRTLDGKRKLQADEFIALCNVLSLDIDSFKKHNASDRE